MYADVSTGCADYFWCTATGSYYMACSSGLKFDDAHQYCNWASDVACTRQGHQFVGYFQTWSMTWASSGADTELAKLASYMDVVILSFMLPDTTYSMGVTLEGTGLQFSSDAGVVKAGIAALKATHPDTKVLVAVGGATYQGWASMNAAGIAAFVAEFGLDGVDVDYEPSSVSCAIDASADTISCTSDASYISAVTKLRQALPRPYILSTAAFSVGAYGLGNWASSPPASSYTGMAIGMMRSAGQHLDLINIMAYDAGTTFVPKDAFAAYRHYFSGSIALGVEVAAESWGDHVISLDEVVSLTEYVQAETDGGMMLWSIQKGATEGPTATAIAQTICTQLSLGNCTDSLY